MRKPVSDACNIDGLFMALMIVIIRINIYNAVRLQ